MNILQYQRRNGWGETSVPVFVMLGFLGATVNHVTDLVRGGLFPYSAWFGAPEMLNVYWTSLTVLDPLAILALAVRVRAGVVFALAIMLTNVPVNLYATVHYWSIPILRNPWLILQTGFFCFLLLTVRRVWKRSAADRDDHGPGRNPGTAQGVPRK